MKEELRVNEKLLRMMKKKLRVDEELLRRFRAEQMASRHEAIQRCWAWKNQSHGGG
jgi:hypothetical protein